MEGRKAVPLFPLGFRFASGRWPLVPVRSRVPFLPWLCVPFLPSFRSLRSLCLRPSAVRSFALPFRLRSVSVLTMAGQHRTGQQGSTGTKQGHGDRLKRFGATRDEGGGVGDTRHFVHSYGLRGDAPSSLCTFLHVTGGAIPSIPFLCSSCPSCGPPCVPAVVPFSFLYIIMVHSVVQFFVRK